MEGTGVQCKEKGLLEIGLASGMTSGSLQFQKGVHYICVRGGGGDESFTMLVNTEVCG